MVATDNAEQFRQTRIVQLQSEKGQFADRRRRLEQEIDDLETAELEAEERLARARIFDPAEGICPRCFIDRSVRNELEAVRKPVSGGLPNHTDLMRCGDCGWDDTIS